MSLLVTQEGIRDRALADEAVTLAAAQGTTQTGLGNIPDPVITDAREVKKIA